MITRITLENFFSFGKPTTIELNPSINVLVGINGSGKSNLLRAIRLLYEGVIGDGLEKIFLKDWSGFDAVANFNQEQKDYIRLKFEFDGKALQKAIGNNGFRFQQNPIYEITIFKVGTISYYLEEKIYVEKEDMPVYYLKMKRSEGDILISSQATFQKYPHYNEFNQPVSFNTSELVLRQISDPDRFYQLFTFKKALEALTIYDYFDTTLKSPIRQPGSYDTEQRLISNGQNLMSILQRIKNHHPLEYDKIEKSIEKINPHFKDINFDFLGSKFFLVLREKHLSKSVSIEHISDGTLRYILLLSIFFNPERGNLICIDEPETGLHPDMINSIAEAIKFASQSGSQLMIVTHSPLLLNAFELEETLIFEKDSTNQTLVNVKTEDDLEGWDENSLLGQFWLRGLIGGKRW